MHRFTCENIFGCEVIIYELKLDSSNWYLCDNETEPGSCEDSFMVKCFSCNRNRPKK